MTKAIFQVREMLHCALQLPDLRFILLELCEMFGIDSPPRLFLLQSMETAIYYMDIPKREPSESNTGFPIRSPMLIITSRLLDVLDHFELESVLAGSLTPCILSCKHTSENTDCC